MNELTKFLIKELLGEPTTVAIYGGGFKPPTKGHFNVAKQTLEEFPEIDELKIFVGKGIRDRIAITQDNSIQIWNIYKNYLSDKVNVEPSPQGEPIMDVIRYARKHPEEKIYWILGARDGDEGDIKDIEQRKKYDQMNPQKKKTIFDIIINIYQSCNLPQDFKENIEKYIFQDNDYKKILLTGNPELIKEFIYNKLNNYI